MKEPRPRLVVIVPTASADLANQAAAISRTANPAARAVVELVEGQHRTRVEVSSEGEAEGYVKALPSLFRAFQPVHPDDILAMLGREVVVMGGGNHFAQQPVYEGRLERVDGPHVYLSGRRVRADHIVEVREPSADDSPH